MYKEYIFSIYVFHGLFSLEFLIILIFVFSIYFMNHRILVASQVEIYVGVVNVLIKYINKSFFSSNQTKNHSGQSKSCCL